MNALKSLQEFLSSKEKESAALAEEKARLDARSPSVQAAYDKIDTEECIPAAAKWNAAKAACSPRAVELEADVRRARAKRDSVKQDHLMEVSRVAMAIETINLPIVREFRELCLNTIRTLGKRYREVDVRHTRAIRNRGEQGEQDVTLVTLRDNSEAINAAKDEVLQAMNKVTSMTQSASLRDLHTVILGYVNRFEHIDLETMTERKVTMGTLRMMRADRTTPMVDGEAVSILAGRVSALERK